MILLSVHHHSEFGSEWTFCGARGPDRWPSWPREQRPRFGSVREATEAAIAWAKEQGLEISVTGHPDREVLRHHAIPYVDSRGNRRRSTRGKGRKVQKLKSGL